jgi:hypothetical protein
LPSPGAANSLGDNKNIVIDTTAPTFTAVKTGLNTIVLTFNEPVTGSASLTSFTVTDADTVSQPIISGTTVTLTTIGLTLANGTSVVTYDATTGDISDVAGNEVADGTSAVATTTNIFCTPPISGDWIIESDCNITSMIIAPGNVVVQSNAIVTIEDGGTLDVDFATNHLLIKTGSKVLIKTGGKILNQNP